MNQNSHTKLGTLAGCELGVAMSTRNFGITPRQPRSNDIYTTTGAFGTDAMGLPPREPIPV